jgi:hypothetical protein
MWPKMLITTFGDSIFSLAEAIKISSNDHGKHNFLFQMVILVNIFSNGYYSKYFSIEFVTSLLD